MIFNLRRSSPAQPAPGAPAAVQPRRVYPRIYVSKDGREERGHHLRGDHPGYVTCPWCCQGQVGPERLQCDCGAAVTRMEGEHP